MAFSFFKKQNDAALTLIIDIGSSSVGAALVRIDPNKIPNILATVREDLSLQEELSSVRFLAAMNHALERALKKIHAQTKGRGVPAQVFCTLSSPWFILKTRHINIAEEKEFTITEKTVDMFLQNDLERMKEELKGTLPDSDIAIIERKILHTKLNGYDIKSPYGKKTTRMEMVATISISSKKVISGIESRVRHLFHAEAIHFGSFPVALFSAVRDMFPTEKDFLVLDITGEATDVSLVNGDLLRSSISFPRGKNFFVREISAALKTPHGAALTLLNMFFHDMLDTKKKAVVGQAIEKGKIDWVGRFEKGLAVLVKEGSNPHKVFFSADADVAPFFRDILEKRGGVGGTKLDFEVQYLDQEIISRFVTCESEVMRDPFLTVEALLARKINSQK